MSRPITEKIYKELCEIIPGGVNSPMRSCKAMKQLPMIASHASGDLVYDVDGKAYIDYCCSWGALIHGHAHPQITQAVQKRVGMGTSFGIATAIEGELTKKMISMVKSLEKIRFVSSGTEATMSAARLARGYTNRDIIVKFNGNYHGHADFFLIQAGSGVLELAQASSTGIPADIVKHTLSLPYNNIERVRSILNDKNLHNQIAAVIIEPIAGNIGVVPSSHEFLKMLREETQKIGALLILDEVITGFRVASGGAQSLYEITPDITCFGKIMGGGFPAAAFGGRKEIMDKLAPLGDVYQAGTLSGNPVAMEAGLQALNLIEANKEFYKDLENKTHLLTLPIKEAFRKKKLRACIQQVGSMFTLFFGLNEVRDMDDAKLLDGDTYARLFRFLFDNGIYIPPSPHEAWFISSAHEIRHLEETRDLILQFIRY